MQKQQNCTWIMEIILYICAIITVMLSYPVNPFLFHCFLFSAACGIVCHSLLETPTLLPFIPTKSWISSYFISCSLAVLFACFSSSHSKIWSTPCMSLDLFFFQTLCPTDLFQSNGLTHQHPALSGFHLIMEPSFSSFTPPCHTGLLSAFQTDHALQCPQAFAGTAPMHPPYAQHGLFSLSRKGVPDHSYFFPLLKPSARQRASGNLFIYFVSFLSFPKWHFIRKCHDTRGEAGGGWGGPPLVAAQGLTDELKVRR